MTFVYTLTNIHNCNNINYVSSWYEYGHMSMELSLPVHCTLWPSPCSVHTCPSTPSVLVGSHSLLSHDMTSTESVWSLFVVC